MPLYAPEHPKALLAALDGSVVEPGDPDWDDARAAWNLAVDQRPEFVVFPESSADVAAVVRFARAQGLRVAPQGTGHNAAALGDLTGTILLRTDRLQRLEIDTIARRVRVEAGVLWGTVTGALAPHGLTALAGSSPDVGVVGLTLGGGYSWLGRHYGLSAGAVTAATLVTGDGRVHHVDEDAEPELLWALRGGAGNAGIVTDLEFEVLPITHVYAGALLFPMDRAAEICQRYAAWTAELEERATTCLRLLRLPPLPDMPEPLRGKSFVAVDGAFDAAENESVALLAPLRDLGPVMDTFAVMPTSELGGLHMDPPHPVPACGDGLSIDGLTAEAITALLDVAGPGADVPLLAVDLRHLGGALGRPIARGGAVDHLPGGFLVYAVGIAPSPQAAEAVARSVESVRAALAPWTVDRDYGNFRELAVPASRLFDAETLSRLRALRELHDPDRVVRSNHDVDVD